VSLPRSEPGPALMDWEGDGKIKWETAMGSTYPRHKFDPSDLEIIDRAYGVACACIEARDLYRDQGTDAEEEAELRKKVFALASTCLLDFDTLCDKVLASIAERRANGRVA
jgi:hypothetical protein